MLIRQNGIRIATSTKMTPKSSGLEPDRRQDRPADRGKRVEHRLDPFIDDGFEPGNAMGEKCEAAADQESRRNRDQAPARST